MPASTAAASFRWCCLTAISHSHRPPLARVIPLSPPSWRRYRISSPSFRAMSSSSSSHGVRAGNPSTITTAPYGTWRSPITADVVSGSSKRVGGMAVAGDGRLLWIETRPEEGGRAVLVKEPEKEGEKPIDITPPGFAVRTLAQEYGGGAFSVSGNLVIFSNYKDQCLYKQTIGEETMVPITCDYGDMKLRYADGVIDSNLKRYITVMEDHHQSSTNPETTIVSIDIYSPNGNIQEPKVLVSGNDFYAFPRIDQSGKKMAWVEWCHPNMPWDGAQLWVGYFSNDGYLHHRVCVAGGNAEIIESPTEPKWSPEGELFFVTDRKSGFWNIYKWIESKNEVVQVYSLDGEFTSPLWVFGISSYDFIKNDDRKTSVVCTYRQSGKSYSGILDCADSSFSFLNIPFTEFSNVVLGNHCLYMECASAIYPSSIAKVTLDPSQTKAIDSLVIWTSLDGKKYRSYFSMPEVIEFPTEVPGEKAYAYFYPPSNEEFQGSITEKPPLLVKCHGGPTGESRGILDLSVQYWTSRGWAFADVNYGGSTGYGRAYRERLLGRWGITDVDDCCSCAKFLVENGKVDGSRLCITGKSAGGYTTLASLAFRNTFNAGSSLYGVADLSMLKAETHKFESRYFDNLIGDENAFLERSPLNHVDKFSCPVILFQGLEDKVVPPDQARKIYQALKNKGIPVALVEYEGEQHGFRKAENIKFTLEQQMMFFARVLGNIKVADEICPIKIDNFD